MPEQQAHSLHQPNALETDSHQGGLVPELIDGQIVKPSEGISKRLPLEEVLAWQDAAVEPGVASTVPRQVLLGGSVLRSQGRIEEHVQPADIVDGESTAESINATLEAQMKEVLAKAVQFLDESGQADLVQMHQLASLVGDLTTLGHQLQDIAEQGPWAGNYMHRHSLMLGKLTQIVEEGQRVARYDLDAQARQARVIILDFQHIAELVTKHPEVSADVRSKSIHLTEFAHSLMKAAGMGYDNRMLQIALGRLGDSALDRHVTVDDVQSAVVALRRNLQGAADTMRHKARLTQQLAHDMVA